MSLLLVIFAVADWAFLYTCAPCPWWFFFILSCQAVLSLLIGCFAYVKPTDGQPTSPPLLAAKLAKPSIESPTRATGTARSGPPVKHSVSMPSPTTLDWKQGGLPDPMYYHPDSRLIVWRCLHDRTTTLTIIKSDGVQWRREDNSLFSTSLLDTLYWALHRGQQ